MLVNQSYAFYLFAENNKYLWNFNFRSSINWSSVRTTNREGGTAFNSIWPETMICTVFKNWFTICSAIRWWLIKRLKQIFKHTWYLCAGNLFVRALKRTQIFKWVQRKTAWILKMDGSQQMIFMSLQKKGFKNALILLSA